MGKNSILKIVDQEIKNWDPVKLLEMGAPKDEYNIEIKMITNRIKNDFDIEDIAMTIYEVLIEMFDKETFSDIYILKDECYNVAKIIYIKLNN